jgi:hypothetical protein
MASWGSFASDMARTSGCLFIVSIAPVLVE